MCGGLELMLGGDFSLFRGVFNAALTGLNSFSDIIEVLSLQTVLPHSGKITVTV